MQREIDQLTQLNCWDLVTLPPEYKAIGCKWVYKTKLDSKGNIVKHKARLVVQGCSQMPSIDFDETYAPMMRSELLRAMAAIAMILNLD
jgi:hypothetical protein